MAERTWKIRDQLPSGAWGPEREVTLEQYRAEIDTAKVRAMEIFRQATGPDLAGHARQKAAAPLKPSKAQEPCDLGLFSDEASQTDLVVLANQTRKL